MVIKITIGDINKALTEKYHPIPYGGKNYYYLAASLNKTEATKWLHEVRTIGVNARLRTTTNNVFGKEYQVYIRRK